MASRSRRSNRPMRRHDMVYVGPRAWRMLLATRGDLAAAPLLARWVDSGWPLVARRAMPNEGEGVALGLPLPPSAGKRRLSFLMQPGDVVATAPPPALRAVRRAAPRAWWSTLDALGEMALRHRVEASVFGSLAWQALTGLDYLTERSDLDVLLHVRRETDLHRLAAALAAIEQAAPMRIDGEFIRLDGAAVNWREFHAGVRRIMVKSAGGVGLLDASRFLAAPVPS